MLAALAVSAGAYAADAVNVPCDPADCVRAVFTFTEAHTECASCTPFRSMYRCPRYENAVDATFGSGFGPWSLSQCSPVAYDPAWFAFSGPGEYDDYVFPKCPDAEFCACGDVKDKIVQLMNNRGSLSAREQNDLYWASLAPNFELVQGFTQVSGGSNEHFEIMYHHPDGSGRKQFCSSFTQSFSYSPQSG
eukprot:gene51159-5429_t